MKISTRYREQEPPNAVQIELVEGCQLRCQMCGLNGIRELKNNNYKFMELKTLRSLLNQMNQLGWNPRIEFAMHGEPSMHPHLADMVNEVRLVNTGWPLMVTSNGGGFLSSPGPASRIAHLFTIGLNTLALDDYQNVKIVPKIRAELTIGVLPDFVRVFDYPAGGDDANPHKRIPGARLIYVEDILHASTGTHSTINNHAGAGAPPNDKGQGKRCAKPFRELSVRWDGSIAICCNDWRGHYKCGNVVSDGLAAVWNGDAMGAARTKLYHGERDFGPCRGCDAISYRVGLLPDKLGKASLPMPNTRVAQDIQAALQGAPYTVPVLRQWERAPEQPLHAGDAFPAPKPAVAQADYAWGSAKGSKGKGKPAAKRKAKAPTRKPATKAKAKKAARGRK